LESTKPIFQSSRISSALYLMETGGNSGGVPGPEKEMAWAKPADDNTNVRANIRIRFFID
jgi:hypothetical protein